MKKIFYSKLSGGLGNNLPTVDTYISPEHRLLHNGKWIKPKNRNKYGMPKGKMIINIDI